MNILITGATGFVGRHVMELLLVRGHTVTAVVRDPGNPRVSRWQRTEVRIADIHDIQEIETLEPARFDAVMHLAWPGLPNYQALSHLDTTFPAECRFLKGLVAAGAKHLLVTGTCFEYGLAGGCLHEQTAPVPVTPYAMAKHALRLYLEELQKARPFRLQWARLFYMYGEGQSPRSLLAQLDTAIDRGERLFNMSGGEQLRDYLPVEKAAACLVALAEHRDHAGTVNVCSGSPISVRRLVENHVARRGADIELNLGYYPYPAYEPMAFWGDTGRLHALIPPADAE